MATVVATDFVRASRSETAPLVTNPPKTERWGQKGGAWWRRIFVPYILSAQLAVEKDITFEEAVEGFLGLVLHVGTWITVVALDLYLAIFHFNQPGSMLHMLMMLALVTLLVAATVVIIVVVLHVIREAQNKQGIRDGLLPSIFSGTIVASARSTLTFAKFMLFFAIFEPVAEVQGDNAVEFDDRALLAATVVLKQLGLTLTMTNHRFKVGEQHVAFSG